jgi:RNA polymerase sigma factor (sigma-70 family)
MSDPERRSNAPTSAAPHQPDTRVDPQVDSEFEKFYRKTTKQLVAFLLMQGACVNDAADIVQHTMTEAYRRWTRIRQPRAWAYRVASRTLIRRFATIREEFAAEPPEPRPPLLRPDAAENWEQNHDISRILAHLPPRQRQVIAWTLSEYTPSEIAAELHMTPEAVRSSLYRARQTLSAYLARKEGDH